MSLTVIDNDSALVVTDPVILPKSILLDKPKLDQEKEPIC